MMAHMKPIETAKRYIELFNARKFTEMGELFAEDSLWESPSDTPATRGRDAIIDRYSAMAETITDMQMTDARFYELDNVVIVEMQTSNPDGPVGRVVDVFDIDNEGRISRMTGYAGPPRLS
ncbi:MAG: hypothetical protein F2923_07160 [Actinobacteria bacterium]|uniref:Unannotated protein n=1 Tax=freshwater metagenome TaxID=449393 RepID=A0A6J7GGA0_9ZZZZ|nr:hypothetical protein [Actinomycetota bacterium]MTB28406.1 hypothetical protein [Actinomycetota bacterium]